MPAAKNKTVSATEAKTTVVPPEVAEIKETIKVKTTVLSNIRSAAKKSSDVVRVEPKGTELTVVGEARGWSELDDGSFIMTKLTEPC